MPRKERRRKEQGDEKTEEKWIQTRRAKATPQPPAIDALIESGKKKRKKKKTEV